VFFHQQNPCSVVFFHQQNPYTWSLSCLYEQNTLWASVRESISQFLQVKVLNLQQWCILNKMSLASTTNASLQNASLTFHPIFLVHVYYFDMLLRQFKINQDHTLIKIFKSNMSMIFWDRSLHRDCSIYIYLCLWEKYLYRTSCYEVWYSSGLEILLVLVKVLGEFVFDKIL
jgi:hypothetical protein